MFDLLRRDIKGLSPHVDDLECVHARNNKEDSRAPGPAGQEATHPEDDGPLKLLNHLDNKHEAEGERDEDQEDAHHSEQPGAGHRAASVQTCRVLRCHDELDSCLPALESLCFWYPFVSGFPRDKFCKELFIFLVARRLGMNNSITTKLNLQK